MSSLLSVQSQLPVRCRELFVLDLCRCYMSRAKSLDGTFSPGLSYDHTRVIVIPRLQVQERNACPMSQAKIRSLFSACLNFIPNYANDLRQLQKQRRHACETKISHDSFSTKLCHVLKHEDVFRRRQKQERKPFLSDINALKKKARLEKQRRQVVQEVALHPPENGLLEKNLVPVSYEVYAARNTLLHCSSQILQSIPVYYCSYCAEVHVGLSSNQIRTCNVAGSLSSKEHRWMKGGIKNILPVAESFHLYDRVGRAVTHNECLLVERVPAILELCMQAGLDLPDYPTRRRTFPVYSISGRIVDFEKRFPRDVAYGDDIEAFGFWEKKKRLEQPAFLVSSIPSDLPGLATCGMQAWEKMRSGVMKLMEKYPVQTCGYCPEVQVGPKGHRARLCQAFKHQMRDGQHAWQEASVDDIIPPVYVWHVKDAQKDGRPLLHELKQYYGKLPAVVELLSQAGACIDEAYSNLLKDDVTVPDLDEAKLVV